MSPHPTPSKGGDDSRVMSAWDVGNGTPTPIPHYDSICHPGISSYN